MARTAPDGWTPQLRHPRESTYFVLAAVAGVIAWLFLIWIVILIGWAIALPVLVIAWFAEKFFRAQLLGNSVRVSETQFPEIYEMARNFSIRLGVKRTPDIFIVNGNGLVSALAIRRRARPSTRWTGAGPRGRTSAGCICCAGAG
jgi:Zn-dependent protease with chaperone function